MAPIFVINLERRPDRLAEITRELDGAGLGFTRVEAVDGRSADPALLGARFAKTGLLSPMSPGEKACGLSHFRAYERFLSSGSDSATHAVILEDDVRLAAGAGALLSCLDWLPRSTHLLKIERAVHRQRPILLGKPSQVGGRDGPSIAPLVAQHLGAAGYIVSRSAAAALLAYEKMLEVPIDLFLFHRCYSPIFNGLKPAQLLPPLVEQKTMLTGDSDLQDGRMAAKPSGKARFRREALRLYHKLRVAPAQIASVMAGEAHWTPIEPMPGPAEAG